MTVMAARMHTNDAMKSKLPCIASQDLTATYDRLTIIDPLETNYVKTSSLIA